MNAHEATLVAGVSGDRSPDVISALSRYALAKGIEQGLEQAMHSAVRQLSEARLATREAWDDLREALDDEPGTLGEGWGK